MNYNTYKLVTITKNMNDGDAINSEALNKEVEGKLVPCTENEAILRCLNKASTVGGNPATQAVKCLLLNPEGNVIKIEEVENPKV